MVAHGRRGREPAGVVRYDAGSGGPQQLSVSGGAIRAGGHTLVMVDPSDNGLWRYTGRDARWQRIAPPGADYAVSSSDIFATTPDLRQVWQYTGSGSDWVDVGDFGRVNSLFACP